MTPTLAPPKGKAPAPPSAPPPNGGQQIQAEAPKLTKLEGVFVPPRIVLNAVEGWGKTSYGAYAPTPAILCARGETGYQTLLGAKRVPSVHAAVIDNWPGLLALLGDLSRQALSFKTLILDALSGFERLCHEHVCNRDFHGEWGDKGFSSYQKGYDISVTDWLEMLRLLDLIQTNGVTIILLSHCQVRTSKQPITEDFDRYVSDVHHKTWAATHKWADAVLFGTFRTIVDTKDNRPKGIGGTDRVLYTERRDAFDAKNRYGMPEQIDIPGQPNQIWSVVWNAITNGKAG